MNQRSVGVMFTDAADRDHSRSDGDQHRRDDDVLRGEVVLRSGERLAAEWYQDGDGRGDRQQIGEREAARVVDRQPAHVNKVAMLTYSGTGLNSRCSSASPRMMNVGS